MKSLFAFLLLILPLPVFSQCAPQLNLDPASVNTVSLWWGISPTTGFAQIHADAISLDVYGLQNTVWSGWGTSVAGRQRQRFVVGPPYGGAWWGAAYDGQRFEVASNENYAGGATFSYWNSNRNLNALLAFAKSASDEIGVHAAVANNEALAEIIADGSDGTAFQHAADILVEVNGPVSAGVVPGRIVFRTADQSGTLSERVRIDESGLKMLGGTIHVDSTGQLTYRSPAGTVTIMGAR